MPFLFKTEQYSIVCIYHIWFIHSFIHLSMDTCIASNFWLLWIMPLWTWVYKYLFKTVLSILWGIYPQVELLDHMVTLFSILWGTAILFSIVTAPFYNPTKSAQVFQVLHILGNTYFLSFFTVAILMCVRWYLTVVLICIFLMLNDVEHLFMCFLAICIVWRNVYLNPLPIFNQFVCC